MFAFNRMSKTAMISGIGCCTALITRAQAESTHVKVDSTHVKEGTAPLHAPTTKPVGPHLSIEMHYEYPFPFRRVEEFVVREKKKGPPDDNVTLRVEGMMFHYDVRMPWYARPFLGRSVHWVDEVSVDPIDKKMTEIGRNWSLTERGSVIDTSTWWESPDDPEVTLYKKTVEFDIKASWSAELIVRISTPLIHWFKVKSAACRANEIKVMNAEIDGEGGGE